MHTEIPRRWGQLDRASDQDVLVGVPSRNLAVLPEGLARWCSRCVVRNYGLSALHLAMVAAGLLDAAIVTEVRVWDIAAASLAVTEAGGVVTDLRGRPVFPMDIPAQSEAPEVLAVLAAGPRLHAELLAAIGS